MENLTSDRVEKEITKAVNEIRGRLKIKETIDGDSRPGDIAGITSQILVTVIGRIANNLGVTLPNNVYIFHDKNSGQLSIKQATQKFIKSATNGK